MRCRSISKNIASSITGTTYVSSEFRLDGGLECRYSWCLRYWHGSRVAELTALVSNKEPDALLLLLTFLLLSERIWPLNGQIDESSGKKIDNEFKNWTPAAESLRDSGFPKYFPEVRVLWMIPSVWEKANVISVRLVIDIVRCWFWNASLYSTTLFVCLRFVPRICEVRGSFKAV